MKSPREQKRRDSNIQMPLPGVVTLEVGGKKIQSRNRRIPHQRIFKSLQGSSGGFRDLLTIYRQEVLPIKTRTIHLLGRKGPARIIHTLLGYEIQASYKRIHAPDLVTARYLKLFTEFGCRTIRLPYDPTVTARLIPELEQGVEFIAKAIRALFPESRALQRYVLQKMCAIMRSRLRAE
jgi:hypothetical protein